MKKRALADFAARLAEIMEEQGYRAPRGSKLRFDAKKLAQIGQANSIETARKWLQGMSAPRLEALHLIAQHFDVLIPWLRDGVAPKRPGYKIEESPGTYLDSSTERMLTEWRHLPPDIRKEFLELVISINQKLRRKAA